MSRQIHRGIGHLAQDARRRRAVLLNRLRRLAVADMDVQRARAALAEAERTADAARIAAGLDRAAA